MSKIRSKNTKPERLIRSLLHKSGYRFRIHKKDLPGKPDIVLPKYKTVIFVHGCFWHYHKKCQEGKIPRTNAIYWNDKFQKNILRDKQNSRKLRKLGWKVIVIWECHIKRILIENSKSQVNFLNSIRKNNL